ncbi:MAG: cytochrome c [Thermodesulfobacteriota bacterium]|nr:MAG: cytochrome c [Thermodesulfobacteriota bacterium]
MRLLKFILINLFFYALLKMPGLLAGKPIPSSVITMYMFFIIVTVLLVMTITDEGAEDLFAPARSLLEDPSKAFARNVLFAVLPIVAALSVYYLAAEPAPPFELRSAHPAPPGAVRAYGKVYELDGLENPLRSIEKEDPAAFKEMVREGGEVYFRNCLFCHGAKLDGRGHYAHAMDPLPMPFTGSDTIAQLKESYLFWRIVKGGPGLPREGGPNISSMPAWEDELTEEEVWKVILFLYDYTGNRPRSWKD